MGTFSRFLWISQQKHLKPFRACLWAAGDAAEENWPSNEQDVGQEEILVPLRGVRPWIPLGYVRPQVPSPHSCSLLHKTSPHLSRGLTSQLSSLTGTAVPWCLWEEEASLSISAACVPAPAQNRGNPTGTDGAIESNAKDFREYTAHGVLTAEVLPPLSDTELGEDILWQVLGQLVIQAPSRWYYQPEWIFFAGSKGIEFNSVQLWHVVSKFLDSVSELSKYSTEEAQARARWMIHPHTRN